MLRPSGAVFRAEELDNYGMLTVDSNLIYSIVDVLLGQNDDQFTVSKTVDGTITVVQGGGGSDTLVATGTAGGTAAPLVLLGDTTQDGRFYNSSTALVSAPPTPWTKRAATRTSWDCATPHSSVAMVRKAR